MDTGRVVTRDHRRSRSPVPRSLGACPKRSPNSPKQRAGGMMLRAGLKPEPINIPVPTAPTIGIPLPSANSDGSHGAPSGSFGVTVQTPGVPGQEGAASGAKAVARQRDFERLSEALAHSEIQPEDLRILETIGHGSSGVVEKVLHTPSNSILALKVIPVNADEAARKSILLELKTLHESMHPAIVSFYGAFYREGPRAQPRTHRATHPGAHSDSW